MTLYSESCLDDGWEVHIEVVGTSFSSSGKYRLDVLRKVLKKMDEHVSLIDERRKLIAEKIAWVEAKSREE